MVQHKDLEDTLELVVDRNIVVEEDAPAGSMVGRNIVVVEEEDAPAGSVVDMLLKDH